MVDPRADLVLEEFLNEQLELSAFVNANSDIARLEPLYGSPPSVYLLVLDCVGLVKRNDRVERGGPFAVEIHFDAEHLRSVTLPGRVVRWLHPADVFNPNIGRGRNANGPIGFCAGKLRPATNILDITLQVFEIVTWNKVTVREDDAMALEPCQWARQNPDAYPIDKRPLFRRSRSPKVETVPASEVRP